MRWTVVFVFMVVSACGSTSGSGDAGDAMDAGDAGDAEYGDDHGDDGLGGWTLRFPAGLELCGWNAMVGQAPPYSPFDHKVRLKLREAMVRWPEEQKSLEVDLLDQVTVGPDGAAAGATGPGLLEAQVYTDGQQDWIGFSYAQEYDLAGRLVEASFGFFLRNPEEAGTVNVTDLLDAEHNTCTLRTGQTEAQVTATALNGDVAVFDYRYILSFACPPGMACLTPYGLGDPDRGEFTRGAGQRVVTSYFRLGLDCMHHGGPERFIMIFDAPLNGMYGVTLARVMNEMQYELTYLDQDLDSAGTSEVVDLQWNDPGR
jgi:hypothetical protein